MKNVRLFLWVTRNLEFTGLKKADKENLYVNYPIIIRKPKALPKACESYCVLYECCKNMALKDRQIIYKNVLFRLSIKQYFMFCALLLWGEIDEKEFNKIDFRTGRCRQPNKKAARNLEKSINILKREIKKKLKRHLKSHLMKKVIMRILSIILQFMTLGQKLLPANIDQQIYLIILKRYVNKNPKLIFVSLKN